MSSPELPLHEELQPAEEVESDQRGSLSEEDEDEEYMLIDLSDLKELKCAICLGIIRNTRTVAECLHRFCKECIEKSMRLGINECPICRVHVPSRRSLREDPNFDILISALVPDIDKYEEQEELTLLEDGRIHNKEVSNENEVMNDNKAGKDLSSADEKTETRPSKGGERETQLSQECATLDMNREGSSSANVNQSNTGLSGEVLVQHRISKFADNLRNSNGNDDED